MSNFTVIDGGMTTELTKMGFVVDRDPLWSARLLQTSPDSIQKAHENYLKAGSEVITTCSYQASIDGFVKNMQISVEEAKNLITSSVEIAKKAKLLHSNGKLIKVAGSVSSFGAIQADGSEYNGNYVDNFTVEELMDWHRPRIELLVNADCDMLALETIPAKKEGIALIRLLKEFPNTKAWLSFSCKDEHCTAYGDNYADTISSCLTEAGNCNQLIAIGVNCSSPEYIEYLAREANAVRNKINPKVELIVYPNNGAIWTSQVGWSSNDKLRKIHSYIPNWIDSGVSWFGGCCQIDHKDISEVINEISKIK